MRPDPREGDEEEEGKRESFGGALAEILCFCKNQGGLNRGKGRGRGTIKQRRSRHPWRAVRKRILGEALSLGLRTINVVRGKEKSGEISHQPWGWEGSSKQKKKRGGSD